MSSGSIIKRPRSHGGYSWLLKYEAGEDPATGKRRQRYKTIRGTKKEAEAELRKLLRKVDKGTHVDTSQETVAEFARYWLESVAPIKAKSATTIERYRQLIEAHIIPQVGSIRIQKLTGFQIDNFYSHLRTEGRLNGPGGLAEQTVLHTHRRLAALLSAALKAGHIQTNPMDRALAKPTSEIGDGKQIRVLDQNERRILLSRLSGTAHYCPTLLALGTGLRRGEILGLQWQDIDPHAGKLKVQRSLEETQKHGLRLKTPKTIHSRRTISLPSFVIDELRRHKKDQAEHFLKLGIGRTELDLVFPKYNGTLKRPKQFGKDFVDFANDAGLQGTTFHALRHTHVTDLLRSGMSIKAVSARAGHKDPTVTLKVYAHVMPGDDEDLAAVTDDIYKSTSTRG